MCKIGKLPPTEMISISYAESVFAFGSNGRDPAERAGITGSEKIILKKKRKLNCVKKKYKFY